MRTWKTIVVSVVIAVAAQTAPAQTKQPDEVPFRMVSAAVEKFEKPWPSRQGPYSEALVLRIEAAAADYETLPPSLDALLYIGDHELPPFRFEYVRGRLFVTFHDPAWQKLKGGEIMVLTALEGDPLHNPGRYAGNQRFDPEIIGRK